jgi:hypothetical protein
MSLLVTLTKVREKCGLTGTTYDARINNLIADWVPVIEFAVRADFIADTGNAGLQATLNLGATELVAGEFLDQLSRESGATEAFYFGWFEITPNWRRAGDPSGLKQQGALRLAPYLKHTDALQGSLGVWTGGSREAGD